MSQPGLAAAHASRGDRWTDAYLAQARPGDVLRDDLGCGARWWRTLLDGVATLSDGHLPRIEERMARQVREIGTAFRLPDEEGERAWPLSGLPLLIGEDEWHGIAEGVAQRAELLERVLGDIYGPQTLIASGALPAAVIAGSRHFVRAMTGMQVPGGRRLHVYAADLGRGPDGEWRVLADHARTPAGAGYALENRLAAGRVMGALHTRLNVRRLAPFFSALRGGLAASCSRSDPRIGLLTPGRYNQSYPEQAHLARYLGLLLVEGADLAVRDGRLYVRTIEGLKRVDALWRRMESRFLDPLAFDSRSAIGVPGLMDAFASGAAVIANAPGAGVAESAALAAFLPRLARRSLGEALKLPNIATWWCGGARERAHVEARFDDMLIGPAFTAPPAGFADLRPRLGASLPAGERAAILAGMARRPQDYVGQEVVRLSTMPAASGGTIAARPFTLRVFAARDAAGEWTVMPGGFVRLGADADVRAAAMGEGVSSADACIVAHRAPEDPITLLPANLAVRRNPGTLPSRAADNLFWLGRYLERGEATLRLIRAALGGTLDAGGAGLRAATLDRIAGLLRSSGAAVIDGEDEEEDEDGGTVHDLAELAEAALVGGGAASVTSLLGVVRAIGGGTRDRLSAEVWQVIDQAPPTLAVRYDPAGTLDCAQALQARFSALAGLAAENMGRTAGWRFHDLGRRIERAANTCRLLRLFADDAADADDLATLLDLTDSQISYRARYLSGLALVPVRDLVGLDPFNPRSVAFQSTRIGEHLAALPVLRDDGMDEGHQRLATEFAAGIATVDAGSLGSHAVLALENRLYALSEAIGARFFLQGAETVRAAGMTLA